MHLGAACGGLLRGFFERDVEQRIDVLRRQVGRVDAAQPADEREGFGGSGEGEIHIAGGKAFFSHASHIGKRAVLL